MNGGLLLTLVAAGVIVALLWPLAYAVGAGFAAKVLYRVGWWWERRAQLRCVLSRRGHEWRATDGPAHMSALKSRCDRCRSYGYSKPDAMPRRRMVRG